MWMNNQYHALPQHLTPCLISRQHNPCNYAEMYFFLADPIEGANVRLLCEQDNSLRLGVQKCAD
jgi:hypothetical protein